MNSRNRIRYADLSKFENETGVVGLMSPKSAFSRQIVAEARWTRKLPRVFMANVAVAFLKVKKLKASMTVARQYFQKLFQFLGRDLSLISHFARVE